MSRKLQNFAQMDFNWVPRSHPLTIKSAHSLSLRLCADFIVMVFITGFKFKSKIKDFHVFRKITLIIR